MKELYDVMFDSWPDGQFRKAGSEVELTEAQAQYLLKSGVIRKKAAAKPQPKPAAQLAKPAMSPPVSAPPAVKAPTPPKPEAK